MRFTTATTFLALAMSISALQSTKMTTATAKDQCTTGDIACCDSKEILSGDGVLGNLLAKGGLNGLLGNDDSACAKTSLLGDFNVLGMNALTCCDDHELAFF
ncbi:Hydrophobin [Penicillium brevicompactum]